MNKIDEQIQVLLHMDDESYIIQIGDFTFNADLRRECSGSVEVGLKKAIGKLLAQACEQRDQEIGRFIVEQSQKILELTKRAEVAELALQKNTKWFADELKRIGVSYQINTEHEAEPEYLRNEESEFWREQAITVAKTTNELRNALRSKENEIHDALKVLRASEIDRPWDDDVTLIAAVSYATDAIHYRNVRQGLFVQKKHYEELREKLQAKEQELGQLKTELANRIHLDLNASERARVATAEHGTPRSLAKNNAAGTAGVNIQPFRISLFRLVSKSMNHVIL